jgi:hypothetical protein
MEEGFRKSNKNLKLKSSRHFIVMRDLKNIVSDNNYLLMIYLSFLEDQLNSTNVIKLFSSLLTL